MTSTKLPPRLAAERDRLNPYQDFTARERDLSIGYGDGFDAAVELLTREIVDPMKKQIEHYAARYVDEKSRGFVDKAKEWLE